MTRSSCEGPDDILGYGRCRGAVASAIRGSRGQAFLRELLGTLDAMPEKVLVKNVFSCSYGVCTLGAVFAARGIAAPAAGDDIDSTAEAVSARLGIAKALAAEVMYTNDEGASSREQPGQRWVRMRKWVFGQIKNRAASVGSATTEGRRDDGNL